MTERSRRIDLTAVNDARGAGCPIAVTGWPAMTRCGAPIRWEAFVTEDDDSQPRIGVYCDHHAHATMNELRNEHDEPPVHWRWVGS